MSAYTELKKKIQSGKAVVAVVGLGYVGLPIAIEFCRKGYKVHGLDSNKRRIGRLKKGISYIEDIPSADIRKAVKGKKFNVTSSSSVLNGADVIIVCVPTPLRKVKTPDISYIVKASRSLSERMRSGQLIIIESTTYPGTTRDVILPILRKSGLELDKDFYLAFSPERIDPGNPKYDLTNIPKVVGGLTRKGTELSRMIYSKIIDRVVSVSSAEAAEVTKLLENTFRIVNIGLINEFAMLCYKLGIDVWEVIDAAKTKPFGYMPFYPGPGIGGHCIPADPMYLSWKARKVGFRTEMVDLAARINRMLPMHTVKRVGELLRRDKKSFREAKILLLGVAYKKDVNDLRESPALEIIETLRKKKADVSYHDPYIPYLDVYGIKLKSRPLTPLMLKGQDAVVIVAAHTGVDYKMIAGNAKAVLDTRNVMGKLGIEGDNIVKL